MDEEYIRKSDVERILDMRIDMIERNITHGKGLKNSLINLKSLKQEINGLYSVKVKFEKEPPICRKPK